MPQSHEKYNTAPVASQQSEMLSAEEWQKRSTYEFAALTLCLELAAGDQEYMVARARAEGASTSATFVGVAESLLHWRTQYVAAIDLVDVALQIAADIVAAADGV